MSTSFWSCKRCGNTTTRKYQKPYPSGFVIYEVHVCPKCEFNDDPFGNDKKDGNTIHHVIDKNIKKGVKK